MSMDIKIEKEEVLSNDKYKLDKITFSYTDKNGKRQQKKNEVYNMGNATTVLLYNKEKKTVLLTKQFRLPSYLNGNASGLLIETCAGKLDDESPEEGIKREIEEEMGYKVPAVQKIMEAYTTPGSVAELIYFFVAEYKDSMKVSDGGGLKTEQEEVEVLELPFTTALQMMQSNEIKDAKTIMLLQYAQLHHLL